ncbi:MAG: 50S ribosomal protein L10 [Oscillospiraceae bacterium]|jgi:large subunit ribosomal protein L10|nr:50S ribosomal protein L10 [Oscillospiraceae bacterium]
MPNTKVLESKKAQVEVITEKLKGVSGVLVDYKGISVAEDTELRIKLRAEGVDYAVVKNTLLRFAVNKVGYQELEPLLSGTTSLATSADNAVAPAKVIKEFADKLEDKFTIKGGFYDGKVISVSEVNALASIPDLPILQAQLLGTLLAPIAQLALVVKLVAEKGGAEAEAPAEVAAPEAEAAPEAAAPEAEAPAEEAAPEAEAEAPAVEAPAEEAEAPAETPAE